MTMIGCRVYTVSGGEYDDSYSYLLFIPSSQPKDRDEGFIPRTYAYQRYSDGTYLGEWLFDEAFLKKLDIEEKPRLKLIAYKG
jgi:hypothetical protein